MAKKFGKLICAKRKTTDLDYTNQQDYDGDDYVDEAGIEVGASSPDTEGGAVRLVEE